MKSAYYNEVDPYCCDWLRNLMAAGLIAPGDVDCRPIQEVTADELKGYTQAHFFAGIGGWSYALRLAGWSDDRPVWTGSCPCQPFSTAGKHRGADDERHLWPAFQHLIAKCRPATCFGEQVASADGRTWLAAVRADMEALGYAVGAADLCAAGVGAPHIRQRLYWVANSKHAIGRSVSGHGKNGRDREDTRWQKAYSEPGTCSQVCQLADCNGIGCCEHSEQHGQPKEDPANWGPCGQHTCGRGGSGGLDDALGTSEHGASGGGGIGVDSGPCGGLSEFDGAGTPGKLGHAVCEGQRCGRWGESTVPDQSGHWTLYKWHECRDGKTRQVPTEPGLFPLADGLSYRLVRDSSGKVCGQAPWRVGLLKGAGNAIVPQVAAVFVAASMGVL